MNAPVPHERPSVVAAQQAESRVDPVADPLAWEVFLAGYESGIAHGATAGHAAGYVEAMTVLDDAGALLAAQKPSSVPSFAQLQRRRAERRGPGLTPEQIREKAAASWGLPVQAVEQRAPTAADRYAAEQQAAEESADDDDWAWQA